MFEELDKQTASSPASQPANNSEATPASTPATGSGTESPVQDIFANVESPTASQPASPQSFAQQFMPAGIPSSSQPVSQAIPKSGFNAKLILIILVILIVAGGGALVYLQYFKQTPPDIITPEAINTVGELPVIPTEEIIATATDEVIVTPTSTDGQMIVGDNGELNAAVEPTTTGEMEANVVAENPVPEANPNLDSDQDGLTDAEELNIYQTNPLQADSDSDGYTDGDEVRAGYNPLGTGKLIQ